MNPVLLAARIILVVLHNVDGNEIVINVDQIVALQHTKESKGTGSNELVTPGVKCVVAFTNGKFVSVVEDCTTVRQAIRQAEQLL